MLALTFTSALALLQQPSDTGRAELDKAIYVAAWSAVAVTAAAIYDEPIAHWLRSDAVQGDSSRHGFVKGVTRVNEVPLTIAAAATYGIGRLTRSRTITDVGLHLTAALLFTEATSEIARGIIGRTRPRESPDDAFRFVIGGGFSRFDERSFPSMHAAAAFATAAALAEELRVHDAPHRTAWTVGLYTAATIPGFTRLYLDQHWASDVVAGTIVGIVLGSGVVRWAHAHRSPLDRLLIEPYVARTADARLVGVALARRDRHSPHPPVGGSP